MLDLQVLVLTLMSLFSGPVPQEAPGPNATSSLIGVREPITADFIVGRWNRLDEFSKWGVTDKEKSRVVPTGRSQSYMQVNADGTFVMNNLFRPSKGRWELTARGLLIYDPESPEHGTELIPIRKRDNNRIWMLLPFSGGSIGIGMARDTSRLETGKDDSDD